MQTKAKKSRLMSRGRKNKMPFESKAQMKAAFGGYLGSDMKKKAPEFARATPDIKSLPEHTAKKKGKKPIIPDIRKLKS